MDLLRSIKTNYTDTVFYERRAFTYWKQLMFACRNNHLPVLNIEYFMLKKKKEYVRILPQDISGALLHGYECVNALYGGNITEKDVLQTLFEHKHLLFIPG